LGKIGEVAKRGEGKSLMDKDDLRDTKGKVVLRNCREVSRTVGGGEREGSTCL